MSRIQQKQRKVLKSRLFVRVRVRARETRKVPKLKRAWSREITKVWHILEKLISLVFFSEISHDELINVVYLFYSDLLLFSKKIGKIVHVANRYKMADIKGPRINTRTSLLKSSVRVFSPGVFVWEVLAYYLSQKPGVFV